MGYKCQAEARHAYVAKNAYRCKENATTEAEYMVEVGNGETIDGVWTGPQYEKKMLPTCARHATDKMVYRRYIHIRDVKEFGRVQYL